MDSPHIQLRGLGLSLAAAGSLLLLVWSAGYKPAGAAAAQRQPPETAPRDSAATSRIDSAEPVTRLGLMADPMEIF
jgi:hypothetical protein